MFSISYYDVLLYAHLSKKQVPKYKYAVKANYINGTSRILMVTEVARAITGRWKDDEVTVLFGKHKRRWRRLEPPSNWRWKEGVLYS